MGTGINIPLEIIGTLVLFALFWLIFYQLHYHESRRRRILLVICMVLYHPVWAVIIYNPFFQLPDWGEMLLSAALIAVLAALAGGKEKGVWITAVYFSGAYIFIDAIASAIALGLSGKGGFSNNDLYFWGHVAEYVLLFLTALFYYFIIRNTTGEDLNRISLPGWLVVLLLQPAGIVLFYLPTGSLLRQLDAGHNNFLFLGLFLLVLLVLNLVILYFFVRSAVDHRAVRDYEPYRGLSPALIKKHNLTGREVEVTEALLRGKSNKEIAVLMNIEVNTVQVHLANIYQKTGAPGRYALMALVGRGHDGKQPEKKQTN
jgi:DNA-binding CsgD family transcriptional regulator